MKSVNDFNNELFSKISKKDSNNQFSEIKEKIDKSFNIFINFVYSVKEDLLKALHEGENQKDNLIREYYKFTEKINSSIVSLTKTVLNNEIIEMQKILKNNSQDRIKEQCNFFNQNISKIQNSTSTKYNVIFRDSLFDHDEILRLIGISFVGVHQESMKNFDTQLFFENNISWGKEKNKANKSQIFDGNGNFNDFNFISNNNFPNTISEKKIQNNNFNNFQNQTTNKNNSHNLSFYQSLQINITPMKKNLDEINKKFNIMKILNYVQANNISITNPFKKLTGQKTLEEKEIYFRNGIYDQSKRIEYKNWILFNSSEANVYPSLDMNVYLKKKIGPDQFLDSKNVNNFQFSKGLQESILPILKTKSI